MNPCPVRRTRGPGRFLAVRNRGHDAFVKGQMGVIKDDKLGSRDACIKSIKRRADLW